MATTINAYSVSLGMDASEFIKGGQLSRSATRELARDIEASRTPLEEFARKYDKLEAAYQKGAISLAVFDRLLSEHRNKLASATTDTNALAEAERKLNDQTRQGEALTKSLLTAEEKHAAEVRRLNELLKTQSIGRETYNRALVKSAESLQQTNPAHQAHLDLMRRGNEITLANLSPSERHQRLVAELSNLHKHGAISLATYQNAVQSSNPAYLAHVDLLNRGRAITLANLTPMERHQRLFADLSHLHQNGAISSATFNRAMNESRWSTWTESVSKYRSAIMPITVGLVAVTAATGALVAAGVAFVNHLKETQDQIDSVADSAGKLGVEYNALIGLRFAAQEAGGVEASAVDAGIKKMQIALSKGSKAFAELGLDASKLKSAGAVEAFSQIADKMGTISNHADKLRLVTEIFGKGGTELVSTLEGGRDAIAESVGFMEKWGALTPAQVLAVQQSNDAWDRIGVVVDGITAKLASEFAAAMLMGSESALTMADAWKSIDDTVTVVVDNVVYQIGALKDMWELLMALKGMPVAGAFEFDSGVKALDALYAKRAALEREASNKKPATAADLIEETATEKIIDREWEAMIDRVLAEEQKRIDAEQRIASTALKNADAHFQRERDNARKLRDDIAKGPQSMEAGSADAAKYMAEQANAAIAASMGLDDKMPTEEQLVMEAKRQTELAEKAEANDARKIALLQQMLEKKPEIARLPGR